MKSVLAALNDLLLPAAKSLYPQKHFDKGQKIAGLKVALLLSRKVANLQPAQPLSRIDVEKLMPFRYEPAPAVKPEKMRPQKLEMPFLRWVGKHEQ